MASDEAATSTYVRVQARAVMAAKVIVGGSTRVAAAQVVSPPPFCLLLAGLAVTLQLNEGRLFAFCNFRRPLFNAFAVSFPKSHLLCLPMSPHHCSVVASANQPGSQPKPPADLDWKSS
ncbi:hypothetical protein Vretimale_12197 [Volvox reticuliferus]|nr:hypothetical protein Vretimale_12197 [Volvox reticuliferus]